MARGDQKRRVMEGRQLDEPGYYAFARVVTEKRHFNIRLASLLRCYLPDPLRLLIDVPATPPPGIQEDEVLKWLCQDCPCPLTVLHCWLAHESEPDDSTWGWLAYGLGLTTERSLFRFGDRAHLTAQHLRSWCAPEGQALDVQVMEVSELAGREITEQDAVEFIYAHPRGKRSYVPQTPARALGDAFYRLTGFRLNRAFAMRLLALLRQSNPPPIIDDCPF